MNLSALAMEDLTLQEYFKEIGGLELLSVKEERELARMARNGDMFARDRLIRANLRFVVTVARQYQNRGLPLADLINEGNMGLIRAVEKFDGERGYKLISYAVWWIRQTILQALAEQVRVVRLPLTRIDQVGRVRKAVASIEQERGKKPDIEEIIEETGLPLERVEQAFSDAQRALSLDTPQGEEGGRSLLDTLPDEKEPLPNKETDETLLREHIEDALTHLSEREAEVLRLYFGLNGRHPLTLDQIGEHYGLTRERVRQIKGKALERLRRPEQKRRLRSHLED